MTEPYLYPWDVYIIVACPNPRVDKSWHHEVLISVFDRCQTSTAGHWCRQIAVSGRFFSGFLDSSDSGAAAAAARGASSRACKASEPKFKLYIVDVGNIGRQCEHVVLMDSS